MRIDMTGRLLAHVTVGLLAASTPVHMGAQSSGPTSRSVYVTVTDGKGAAVTDLTPADFVVKEGGKERQVEKAAPATARMRLALAVEERLTADGPTRQGIFEFVQRVSPVAEISLIAVGLSNRTVVDYTSDPGMLVNAITSFSLNASRESNVAEGILELANAFTKTRPERPVLVVVAISGGQAGIDARVVLEKLVDSRATMHTVTLMGPGMSAAPVGALGDESGRDQVLGDGPKQTGGRHVDVNATPAIPKALQQVADDLLAQYAITYLLPDGVKPSRRFSVSTKRRGVSLRAPTTISDR